MPSRRACMPRIRRAISAPPAACSRASNYPRPAGRRAGRCLDRDRHRSHRLLRSDAGQDHRARRRRASRRSAISRPRSPAARIDGIETNLPWLVSVLEHPVFAAGKQTTALLSQHSFARPAIEVLAPGTLTTVQDWPGRLGLWDVGVPPSGPMDALALRLANRIVGNEDGCAALEMTVTGATLRFDCRRGDRADGRHHGRDARWRRR